MVKVLRVLVVRGRNCVDSSYKNEILNRILRRVIVNASFLRNIIIVGGWLNNIKVDMSHPEMIVPSASRLRDLVKLGFSSFVGDMGRKEGFFIKQKKMIRNE